MRFTAVLLSLLALTHPAFAGLHLCNRTAREARVAVGRFNGETWMSEGWWTVAPSKCAQLVPGKLTSRYYYLYAVDGGAGAWNGARKFCVGMGDKFQALGRGNCAAQGMDSKGFFAVDTGDAADYTQSLSD